jgi:hypothetical protein
MPTSIARMLAVVLVITAPVCAAQPAQEPPHPSSPAPQPAAEARLALDRLVAAYERSDVAALRSVLDPGFLGIQRFIDSAQLDFHANRLLRIHFSMPRTTIGPDVVVLQIDWEKRFVDAETFQPGATSGRMTVLMHRTAAGWRLAALHGDSPFALQSAAASSSRSARRARPASGALP